MGTFCWDNLHFGANQNHESKIPDWRGVLLTNTGNTIEDQVGRQAEAGLSLDTLG